jgi:hypothetical protein
VEELRGSLSPVSLPPLLPRGDTFGDFIIEYPPRQLHLYPRVAGDVPTAYVAPGGLFDLDLLTTHFGDTCQQFEDDLHVRSDEIQQVKVQIWAAECLIKELQEMVDLEGNTLEALELERSILDAEEEISGLLMDLATMRRDAQRSMKDVFAFE